MANLNLIFSKDTVQKGGILFEDIGTAQINGEYMTYKRVADTSVLETATQTSSDLTTIYSVMCQGVQSELRRAISEVLWKKSTRKKPEHLKEKWDTIMTPIKYPLKEAERVCKNLNAQQPEIHTWDDYTRIMNLALKHDIQLIKAGIEYQPSTQTFRYKSNAEQVANSKVFPKLRYGGEWPTYDHEAAYNESKWVLPMAHKYFLAYKNPGKNFHVRMVSTEEMNVDTYIICERAIEDEKRINGLQDNMLFQMIAHNCKRDREAAINIMALTIAEARSITNLKITVNNTEPNYAKFFPKMSEFEDISDIFNYKEPNDFEENKREKRSISKPQLPFYAGWPPIAYALPNLLLQNLTVNNTTEEMSRDKSNEEIDKKSRTEETDMNNMSTDNQFRTDGGNNINNVTDNNNNDDYEFEQNFSNKSETNSDQPISRQKRVPLIPVVATILGSIMGANVISSASSGEAPLSWFGGTFGSLLGLATARNPAMAGVLSRMATEIDTLKMNNEKIVVSFNEMVDKAIKFEKKFAHNAQAMALMIMERDLFQTIKYVSQVLQSTVQKFAQILASAAVGKTSPYAMTVSEVEHLSKLLYAGRGFLLDTNLNNIRSMATIEKNQLVLIFQIPILDEQKQYHFHQPVPIPIFTGDEVHIPELDTKNIAISKSGSRYVPITEQEYHQCMKTPLYCELHQPSRPSHDAYSCTIMSYITDEIACPVKKIAIKTPMFYYMDDNLMYYSVKNNTKLFIKCERHRHTTDYAEEVLQLSGQGQVKLRSSCTITTPDGSVMRTKSPEEIYNLTDVPVFEILKHFPQPTGYEITNNEMNETIFNVNQKIEKPEEDKTLPSLSEVIAEALKPKKSLIFIVSAIMLAGVIVSILILLYLCRYKGMACLRIMHLAPASKNNDVETVTDIEEKRMRTRMQQLQKDIYEIQEKIKHPHDRKQRHQRSQSVSMNELHDITKDPIYTSMNSDTEKYSHEDEISKFTDKYRDRYPESLRRQLDQADRAYRKQ